MDSALKAAAFGAAAAAGSVADLDLLQWVERIVVRQGAGIFVGFDSGRLDLAWSVAPIGKME